MFKLSRHFRFKILFAILNPNIFFNLGNDLLLIHIIVVRILHLSPQLLPFSISFHILCHIPFRAHLQPFLQEMSSWHKPSLRAIHSLVTSSLASQSRQRNKSLFPRWALHCIQFELQLIMQPYLFVITEAALSSIEPFLTLFI